MHNLPDFWLHWETIASRSQLHNWEIKTHKHDAFLQILYLRDGTGDAVFNDETHPILPPVMIAIPAKYEHGFRFSKDIDGTVITMAASRFGALGRSLVDVEISKWFSRPHLVPLDGSEGDKASSRKPWKSSVRSFMQGGLFHTDLVEVHLRTAILMAARMTPAGQPATPILRSKKTHE